MDRLARTFNGFLWFVSQAIAVGGFGVFVFAAIAIPVVVFSVWRYRKIKTGKSRLAFLLTLPVFWLFEGLWGAYHWYDWQTGGPRNPAWVLRVLDAATLLFLFMWAIFLVWLKGARAFTLAVGFANLYFVLVMWLLATMAITGNWL